MRIVGLHGSVYEVTTLPGCSQVAVSHSLFMPEYNRGKGLSRSASIDRITNIQCLGYDLAICTVDLANIPQVKTLSIPETGWTFAHKFRSSKTGHEVGLYFNDFKTVLSGSS